MASDFRTDRDWNPPADLDDKPDDNKPNRWPYKRRTFPQQPRGAYLKILDELIERSRAEREQKAA
jgi:hypothetical protein